MTAPAPQGKTARIGRYDIHHVDEGSGFPILLIHGLAGDHSAWMPQIAAWRDQYRVIAADTRGQAARLRSTSRSRCRTSLTTMSGCWITLALRNAT